MLERNRTTRSALTSLLRSKALWGLLQCLRCHKHSINTCSQTSPPSRQVCGASADRFMRSVCWRVQAVPERLVATETVASRVPCSKISMGVCLTVDTAVRAAVIQSKSTLFESFGGSVILVAPFCFCHCVYIQRVVGLTGGLGAGRVSGSWKSWRCCSNCWLSCSSDWSLVWVCMAHLSRGVVLSCCVFKTLQGCLKALLFVLFSHMSFLQSLRTLRSFFTFSVIAACPVESFPPIATYFFNRTRYYLRKNVCFVFFFFRSTYMNVNFHNKIYALEV